MCLQSDALPEFCLVLVFLTLASASSVSVEEHQLQLTQVENMCLSVSPSLLVQKAQILCDFKEVGFVLERELQQFDLWLSLSRFWTAQMPPYDICSKHGNKQQRG